MKLKLPNNEVVNLDNSVTIEEKVQMVEGILSTWEDSFVKTWGLSKTKVCLEVLSNYLVFHKEEEEKNKTDKFILSRKRVREMEKGTRSTPFSMLPDQHKLMFGLVDAEL